MMVRKDLWDSGAIRSPRDLRGRRVSFATEGSPIDYMMRSLIQQHGLTQEDMEVVRLTSSDVSVGFQNRALDVATASEPFPTQAEQSGLAVKWLHDGDVVPGAQISAILASERLGSQPDVARAFMVGYLRAVREYLEANSGRADEGMLAAISKWTSVPGDVIRASGAPYIRPNGRVDIEEMNRQQDFWIREGVMREKADVARVVDHTYADYAVRLLDSR
jgi:ABC-type nitrate/sulfonate/bicarbonate transport system substrate-binding protein